ncbi:MAG: TonB-dependent receptor [Alphaproteobacteria bacterium]|nr:TonB-dependent receptor [Alphaproteobacteria bacterium]
MMVITDHNGTERRRRLALGAGSFALAGFSAATALCLFPASAAAQNAEAQDQRTVNEIIVTAQRREEAVQDIPLAVSAFDEAAIENLNARDIRDLTGVVPNLVISEVSIGPSMTQVSLRGVNSQDPEKSFDPAVGVFVDGVYLGTSAFNLLNSFDLERIEILRGPQGTLFGRNTTGGAVNAFRTRPTGEFGVRSQVIVGSDDRLDAQGIVNLSLAENLLALKLSGYGQTDGGLWDNPAGGATGAKDRWGAGARMLWTPTPDFEVDFIYDHAEDNSELTPYIPRGIAVISPLSPRLTQTTFPTPATVVVGFGPDRLCTIAGGRCLQNDFSFSRITDPHFQDSELDAFTVNADWDVSDALNIAAVFGWRDSSEAVYIDFDGTDLTIFNVVRKQDYSQWSGEIRLASDFDGPFNFVAGLYHFESEYALRQAIKLDAAMVAPVPALGVSYVNGSGDEDNHEASTTAVFAQVDWALTDAFTLTLGGRGTWDEKEVYTRFVGAPPGVTNAYQVTDGILPGRPITSQGGANEEWFEFTPRVAVNWRLNEDFLAYASYTRGYNAGGFSARAGTVADVTTPFDPEFINAYEVGFKSDWFDRRARLNVALFYNDYEDKQEEAIQPGPPPTFTSTTVRNVSGARIMGLEVEATAILNDYFRIDASLGVMDGEYTDYDAFLGSGQYVSTPAQPSGTLLAADFTPLTLRRLPEVTASITPAFEAPLGPGMFSARSTVRYVSEQYAEFFNDPRGLIPDQTFVDASISYAFAGPDSDRVRVTLFGENLTENQEVSSFTNSIVDFGTVAAPRTWGVEVQVRY